MNQNERPEEKQETLATLRLSEYQNLSPELKEWLHRNEEVPPVMWEQLADLEPNLTLMEVLQKIRSAFATACGDKKSRPASFEESRFTPFTEIIERGLNSCGVRARVYGTTLRKLGVPVKFIDGKHTEGDETYDHAWLGIYAPSANRWLESDPGTETFEHDPRNQRERIFHDWDELRARHQET